VVNGLESAIIWTDDIGRLLPFYRDLLGLKPEFESDEFVAFGSPAGGMQLGLGRHTEVSGSTKDPFRMMLNLSVDDCQAEYDRLSGQGVEFLREPSAENENLIMATLKDPDGNVLQLMQQS
jgi:predicted enzyme related to lactoylglutathione lyase